MIRRTAVSLVTAWADLLHLWGDACTLAADTLTDLAAKVDPK